jgi:hypothetical protein
MSDWESRNASPLSATSCTTMPVALAAPSGWEPAAWPPALLQAEQRLMRRVYAQCHNVMVEAAQTSSIPVEFLAALTANESGGNPRVSRFEPSVYEHLKAVAAGRAVAFGQIRAETLKAAVELAIAPKADEFHAHYLTPSFAANNAEFMASLTDQVLRQLATSWGFTQVMGYHVIARRGAIEDLTDPERHFRYTLAILSEFAHSYQLDVRQEFAELFRCWNTGRPYGKTFDPEYVEKGLRRMSLYAELLRGSASHDVLEKRS